MQKLNKSLRRRCQKISTYVLILLVAGETETVVITNLL